MLTILLVILGLLVLIAFAAMFGRRLRGHKVKRVGGFRDDLPLAEDEWTAADFEAADFHDECGDR